MISILNDLLSDTLMGQPSKAALKEVNVSHIIFGHGPLSSNKDIEEMKAYLPVFDRKQRNFAPRKRIWEN